MNTSIKLDDVRTLASTEAENAVSIYLPTHRRGPEIAEDTIRLKNALGKAERLLKAREVPARDIEQRLFPARRLLNDRPFWQHQGDGLALFLADDAFHLYKLPVSVEELAVVGTNLHVVPLIQAVEDGSEFYVLAASRKHVRLLHGTRSSVGDVEVPDMPAGVDELFTERGPTKKLHYHTTARSPTGGESSVFHGIGDDEQAWTERALHFLRAVDEAIGRVLPDPSVPLVFAGDKSLFPLFKEANSHRGLRDGYVMGNPDELGPEELHVQALAVVTPEAARKRQQAVAAVQQALAGGQGDTKAASIVAAAEAGRVASLLIASRRHVWGRVNTDDGNVQVLPERTADAEDLLNRAAAKTLVHGGTVLVVEGDRMPGPNGNESSGCVAAAAYRF